MIFFLYHATLIHPIIKGGNPVIKQLFMFKKSLSLMELIFSLLSFFLSASPFGLDEGGFPTYF